MITVTSLTGTAAWRHYHLHRLSPKPLPRQRRPVNVMPVHHLLQRAQELLQTGPRRKPHHHRRQVHIGTGAGGHQVMEEQTFLQRRQRINIGHVRRPALDRRGDPADLLPGQLGQRHHLRGDLLRPGRDQVRRHRHLRRPGCRGQPGRGRRLEQRPHRHRHPPLTQPLHQRHRQQRMPAQRKETVLSAHPSRLQAQHLRERRAHDLFHGCGRPSARPGGGVVGCGQRPAVDLPAGRQRQLIQHHHRRRQHVPGQPLPGEPARRGGQPRARHGALAVGAGPSLAAGTT